MKEPSVEKSSKSDFDRDEKYSVKEEKEEKKQSPVIKTESEAIIEA